MPHFKRLQPIDDVISLLEGSGIPFESSHYLTILYHEYGYREKPKRRMTQFMSNEESDVKRDFARQLADRLGMDI